MATLNSKEKKDEKPVLSFADAMEMMKDPKALAAAAAMHGFTLSAPKGNKEKEEKEETLTPPGDIEIDENATSKDVLAAMQKLIKQNNEYLLKQMDRSNKSVDKKLQGMKYEQQANEVGRFIKKNKIPQELLSDMDAFWRKGDSLEEAYEKAKKLNGIAEEPKDKDESKGKDGKSKSKEAAPRKSPRISEEEGDEDDLKKVAPKNINDAARNNLKEMMANNPDIAGVLSGEPGLDDINERVG